MRDFSTSHEWLSINTATVRKQWTLPQIIDGCARAGITTVSPWRDQVAACGLDVARRRLRETGIKLSGYCRGGLFPAADIAGTAAALADNFRAVDEACELGSPCLVLVVGGLPGALEGRAAHKDIAHARAQVTDGIAQLLEYSRPRGMPLAIEPLHPMYAADRACVNTTKQALFLPTSREAKYKAKQAIDSFFVRFGDMLQAGVVFVGVQLALGIRGFALVNIVLTGVWFLLVIGIRREHEKLTGSEAVDRAA